MKIMRILLTLSLLPFLSGCVAIVAGGAAAGGVAFYSGKLEANVQASGDEVADAIDEARSQLRFALKSSNADAMTGKYEFVTGDGRDIVIKYESQGSEMTTVTIRVGIFGDEPLSLTILDKIKGNL